MKIQNVNFRHAVCVLFLSIILGIPAGAQVHFIPDSTHGIDAVSWDGGVTDIEFNDINDDGFLDFLTIGDHGCPGVNTNQHGVMIWFGNGTGTNWNVVQNGTFGYGGLAVGDVNNDGKKDIGYAMHHDWSSNDFGNQYQEVALGDGTGLNWTAWDDSLGLNGETWGMSGTDFGDIDNDGYLDIGSISLGCCDGIHIHKNLNTGVWPQAFGILGGNSNMKIRFGDIDNDGNLDFVVGHQNGTCYFGDGHGNFTVNDSGITNPGPVGYLDLTLADIDNDGTLELGGLSGGVISLYKFSIATHTWQNISTMVPAGTHYSLLLKDFNMDGFVDMLTFQHERMTLFLGDGGNNWLLETTDTIKNLERVFESAAADVDHSGTPDVVMLGRYPTGIVTDVTKMKFFHEATVATALNISAVYPKGYECMPNNGVRFIEWITSVPQGMKSKVTLELSTGGPAGPWSLIASDLPDNGRYQWLIPSALNSTNCQIRYTVTDSITGQTTTAITPHAFNIGCNSSLNSKSISSEADNITVYPNPFHDKAYFSMNGKEAKSVKIGLYDIEGRMVQTINKKNGSLFIIEKNSLESGVYLLKISEEGSYDIVKRIILQ